VIRNGLAELSAAMFQASRLAANEANAPGGCTLSRCGNGKFTRSGEGFQLARFDSDMPRVSRPVLGTAFGLHAAQPPRLVHWLTG